MTRFVIDTNVVVSGVLFPGSKPGRVLDLMLAGEIPCVASAELLDEYRDVLKRPKFSLDATLVDGLVDGIEALVDVVVPPPQAAILSDDPKDQFVIDLAVGSDAYVVTGNARHFARYPKAIDAATLLEMLAERTRRP